MAHPVRPDSYIEISNFYTVTVYNKGAEVIRMMHTLLGAAGFRKGLDLYFARHDGQAVTTEDFVAAMEDASGVDLEQFRLWYVQAGTPEVRVEERYDAADKSYFLALSQSCPPTPGQPTKRPFHIPLAVGLLDSRGADMTFTLEADPEQKSAHNGHLLNLRHDKQTFRFANVAEKPLLSLGRGFSAPIKIVSSRNDAQTAYLLANDNDPFNRWDAGQEYATKLMFELIDSHQSGRRLTLPHEFADAMRQTLSRPDLDKALVAETLTLPSETYLADRMSTIDVDAIHQVHTWLRRALAEAFAAQFREIYMSHSTNEPYRFEPAAIGRRALRNLSLAYLMMLGESEVRELAMTQLTGSDNMTDALAALATLAHTDCDQRKEAIAWFHERWKTDSLVLDKWFSLQATSPLEDTLDNVVALMRHDAFALKKPNKVRALIGAFSHGNQIRFHHSSGEGYRFLADRIVEIDPLNPQVAARLLGAFTRWRKLDPARRTLIKAQLERILGCPNLSKDTYEIATKTLG